ncbi:MAG: archaemetzincin family Zn-dependent metalloprotease [Archaeoglobaceae archaeon]|nr:archaemetzincin family Zn-dependent metalloprotease [Archaeoglobaceae archaeon]MDW8118955.1 archaemetzincin family Zn-dependent metalloprotease [Archaeoglobaceae archaeon]
MIQLQPLGEVDKELVEWLAKQLKIVFKTEVSVLPALQLPSNCYTRRGQYNSTCIISKLKVSEITLAITSEDLYAKGLNFVFGEAELGGLKAIVSYYRLKFGVNREELKIRLLKESVHELGHVFGLEHCKTNGCVMNFSNNVFEVDKKSSSFCERCRSKISFP